MLGQLKKLKNLIANPGYEEENVPLNAKEEQQNETSYKKERNTEDLICDCCKQNTVTEETVDVLSNKNGEFVSVYKEPKVTYHGGKVEENVIICDECLAYCGDDPSKKRYAILSGMLNKINTAMDKNAEKKVENEQLINDVMLNAQNQIAVFEKENQDLDEDTRELSLMAEQISQELIFVEKSFE